MQLNIFLSYFLLTNDDHWQNQEIKPGILDMVKTNNKNFSKILLSFVFLDQEIRIIKDTVIIKFVYINLYFILLSLKKNFL